MKIYKSTKIILLLFFASFVNTNLQAQTEKNKEKISQGRKLYREELEAITIISLILINNKVEVSKDQIDLASLYIVNPEFPNIPLGDLKKDENKAVIDLSNSPAGVYYIKGKLKMITVAYKTSKM